MKCLFVVQGEGRGHMTQAIALRERLEKAGHEVCLTMVGVSRFRTLPDFFAERMGGPVTTFESPVLVTDRNKRGVSIARTALNSFLSFPRYALSVFHIRREINRHNPAVVVNFFDLMCSISFLLRLRRPRHVCVGHQFYFQHPDFIRPKTSLLGELALRLLTGCSAFRADLRLALSFRPGEPAPNGLRVVAPLLRREIREEEAHDGSHLVAYLLNPGYAEQIEDWHRKNQDVVVHGFWDRPGAAAETVLAPGLTFHALDDRKFVRLLAGCRALITTAGFEAVCEAMYLGKPVLVVATAGHVEQHYNAADAESAGCGVVSDHFDPCLLDGREADRACGERFRAWVDTTQGETVCLIEDVVCSHGATTGDRDSA